VASTQGEIGYLLQQSLSQELAAAALPVPVVAVLTQVVVADDDPAFRLPTKPIGPFYSRAEAEDKWRRWGWQMVEDAARGFRRVVASPEPREIVEEQAIRRMLDQEILVIAMGGGGIPVVREDGILRGADAVIDKDRASVLLAMRLGLERVIFSTDADYVYVNFRKPSQQAIERATANEMKAYLAAGHFPAGNMGPKIEAALRFLQNGGREVVVTSHERVADAFHGRTGTRIVSSSSQEK